MVVPLTLDLMPPKWVRGSHFSDLSLFYPPFLEQLGAILKFYSGKAFGLEDGIFELFILPVIWVLLCPWCFDFHSLEYLIIMLLIWEAEIHLKVKAFVWSRVLNRLNISHKLQVRRPHKVLFLFVVFGESWISLASIEKSFLFTILWYIYIYLS